MLGGRPITCPQKIQKITETVTYQEQISNGEAVAVDGRTAGHTMTSMSESLREAPRPTRSLAMPKSKMRVGCWNIRTMYTVGKGAQVAREMERYRLDLMGLSEIRWTGAGRITIRNGYSMIYAGEESEHQRRVAMMMSQNTQKSLIEWTPVSSRIITARFYSRFKNTTVIQVYAPTNESTDDEKDDFYDQLLIHATDMT